MSDAVMQDELLVPAMGFAAGMVSVAVWLVDEGATVLAGDRVVQLVAGAGADSQRDAAAAFSALPGSGLFRVWGLGFRV